MAAACLPDVDAALAQLADDYIAQDYPHAPGKAPTPRDVSTVFAKAKNFVLSPRSLRNRSSINPNSWSSIVRNRSRLT